MKKSELKAGMVVRRKKYTDVYIVMLGTIFGDILFGYNTSISLDKYNEDLESLDESEMDINEVYQTQKEFNMNCHNIFIQDFNWIIKESKYMELLWKRD